MSKWAAIIIVLAIAGCANEAKEASALVKNDAIDDFIKVAELEEAGTVRTNSQQNHRVITAKYIVVSDRKTDYLLVFRQRCHQTGVLPAKPDVRRDGNVMRARSDTYRGCRIQSIYKLTKGQAEELLTLGTTSGQ